MLSIVLPTYNEIPHGYIQKSFPLLAKQSNIEVIIVDGGSTDGTIELAQKHKFQILTSTKSTRAGRINEGLKPAKANIILLHHPRSLLTQAGLDELSQVTQGWGVFRHRFDTNHPLLKFTSWWSNYGRGSRGIFYLDHCIFLSKNYIQDLLAIPEKAIFEDTEICKVLRKKEKPILLKSYSTTSAIRFTKNGVLKQSLHNQVLKWQYYFKADDKSMNQGYEKDLELNGKL